VLIVALSMAVVLLLVAVLLLWRRTRRTDSRLRGITRGAEGSSLEAVLDAHLDKVFAVARELDGLGDRMTAIEGAQRKAFQRVGLVRYNPFEETGGNQSFALALLDAAGDGWVLSSLHARSGTRVYAKTIKAGRADVGLSAEETAAITRAMA
jgi:Flp pilus assembly protein TadB